MEVYNVMKKNMEEHMVEVNLLLLLLHHTQVHLPLLLLLLPLTRWGTPTSSK